MNNYLYHHGVKGMRWGVRKKNISPEKALKRSNRNKKIKKVISTGMNIAIAGLYIYGAYKIGEHIGKSVLNKNTVNAGKKVIKTYTNTNSNIFMKDIKSYSQDDAIRRVAKRSALSADTVGLSSHGSTGRISSYSRGVGQHLGQYRRG